MAKFIVTTSGTKMDRSNTTIYRRHTLHISAIDPDIGRKAHRTKRNLHIARAILHNIPLATSHYTRTLHTLRVQDRSQLHHCTVVPLLRLVTTLSHHGSAAFPTGSIVSSRSQIRLGPQKHTPSTTTATSQRQVQTIPHYD